MEPANPYPSDQPLAGTGAELVGWRPELTIGRNITPKEIMGLSLIIASLAVFASYSEPGDTLIGAALFLAGLKHAPIRFRPHVEHRSKALARLTVQDQVSYLERLVALREVEAINQAEFEQTKRRILG